MVIGVGYILAHRPAVPSVVGGTTIHRNGDNRLWIVCQVGQPFLVEPESIGGEVHPTNVVSIPRCFEGGTDHIWNQEWFATEHLDGSTTIFNGE